MYTYWNTHSDAILIHLICHRKWCARVNKHYWSSFKLIEFSLLIPIWIKTGSKLNIQIILISDLYWVIIPYPGYDTPVSILKIQFLLFSCGKNRTRNRTRKKILTQCLTYIFITKVCQSSSFIIWCGFVKDKARLK